MGINELQESSNFPKKITTKKFRKNTLGVTIDVTKKKPFKDIYEGYAIYITNTKRKPVEFPIQDSKLYMNLQAKDLEGNWKDIQVPMKYHRLRNHDKVVLKPNEYWQFVIPKYEGSIETKLRLKLYLKIGEREKVIFSNEIKGSVNPGQFFNSKLMDLDSDGIRSLFYEIIE